MAKANYSIDLYNDIISKPLPRHIAIIMDGNGRWAKKRGLIRSAGHRQGVESMRGIIELSGQIGLKNLTLYAFSTENWNRPKNEVRALMLLLVEYLKKELKSLHENNVKIRALGHIDELPKNTYNEIVKAIELTKGNDGLGVNVALNYGGRSELVDATKKIVEQVIKGHLDLDDIDEELISENLFTAGIEDPDLLIRTGGDIRISNFLLYQMAYTELWFSDKDLLWPEFTENDYLTAISDYQSRQRRFGKVISAKEDN